MSAIRDFFLPSLIFLLVSDFSLLRFLTFALHYFSLHSFFICTLPTFLYSLCWFHFFLLTLFSSYRSFYPNFIFRSVFCSSIFSFLSLFLNLCLPQVLFSRFLSFVLPHYSHMWVELWSLIMFRRPYCDYAFLHSNLGLCVAHLLTS